MRRGEGLLTDGFEGRFEGRVRDRRRRELLGGLKNRSNYVQLKRRAKDRFNIESLVKKTCLKV